MMIINRLVRLIGLVARSPSPMLAISTNRIPKSIPTWASSLAAILVAVCAVAQPAQAWTPLIESATVDYTHKTLTISGQYFGSYPIVTLDALTFPTVSAASGQIVADFPNSNTPSSFAAGTYYLTVTFKNQSPVIFAVALGANGPQGPVGATGPAGAKGAAGPQGPVGLTGATGPAGPAGPQGLAGPVGPVGASGATGAQGPQGLQGLTGATGATGATGPAGPAGSNGANGAGFVYENAWTNATPYTSNDVVTEAGTSYVAVKNNSAVDPSSDVSSSGGNWAIFAAAGAQGPAGLTGATGPAGPQGQLGPQGPQGNTGAIGPQGLVGATGPAGPAGPVGPPGLTGAQGPAGPTGPTGPTGPQGQQGIAGATGAAGAAGPQGNIGATGPQGPQGPAGTGYVVKDSKGTVIGPYIYSDFGPSVVITTSGMTFVLQVNSQGFVTVYDLGYTSTDCSGTPYNVYGYDDLFTYAFAMGNTAYVAGPVNMSSPILVYSAGNNSGGVFTCYSNYYDNAYHDMGNGYGTFTAQVDLSALALVPPFSVTLN